MENSVQIEIKRTSVRIIKRLLEKDSGKISVNIGRMKMTYCIQTNDLMTFSEEVDTKHTFSNHISLDRANSESKTVIETQLHRDERLFKKNTNLNILLVTWHPPLWKEIYPITGMFTYLAALEHFTSLQIKRCISAKWNYASRCLLIDLIDCCFSRR